MRYISNGPMLVDVSMTAPTRVTRNFMDSLLAFWPGLQVGGREVPEGACYHGYVYMIERYRA